MDLTLYLQPSVEADHDFRWRVLVVAMRAGAGIETRAKIRAASGLDLDELGHRYSLARAEVRPLIAY